MIPYARQDISAADIEAVVQVLRSDWLTQGPAVPAFERAVAARCGAGHGVAACNATAALHMACLALGVGPGDRVWTSAITFAASANCALYCGATVDFVDIDPATFNMSVDDLAARLAQAQRDGTLPKVVIPVHLCGQSCDMQGIGALARRYGFRVIEDASHAIGASYQGAPVGDCRYSDITVFSFHPVKIITTGEGGMAMTQDAQLARRLDLLRNHGNTRDPACMDARPAQELWNYQQVGLGFNYRMTDMAAALGASQLQRLDHFLDRRRAIARHYDQALAGLPLVPARQHPDTLSSYHLYPVRLELDGLGISQREVYDAMHARGILVNLHYIPVYRQPYYERMGFRPGHCPQAERYHAQALSLPMYPALEPGQQACVVSALQEVLRR